MFISAELFKEYVRDMRETSIAGVVRQAYIIYGKDKIDRWAEGKKAEGWMSQRDREWWDAFIAHAFPVLWEDACLYREKRQAAKPELVDGEDVCPQCHRKYRLHAEYTRKMGILVGCKDGQFLTLKPKQKKVKGA